MRAFMLPPNIKVECQWRRDLKNIDTLKQHNYLENAISLVVLSALNTILLDIIQRFMPFRKFSLFAKRARFLRVVFRLNTVLQLLR